MRAGQVQLTLASLEQLTSGINETAICAFSATVIGCPFD